MATDIDLQASSTVGVSLAAQPPALTQFLAARTVIRTKVVADGSQLMGDWLKEIDVSTGIKPGDPPDEMQQRQQVQAKYIFNNDT
jgi:hypothetical protein